MDFGFNKSRRYYPIDKIVICPGGRSKALILFHSFTGCDQVSYFAKCGKTTAWKTWNNFPEITEIFIALGSAPTTELVCQSMPMIEKFVCLMYKPTTSCESVDDLRRELFTKEGRDLESIPPTSAALFQHTLRAAFVAGHIWRQSLVPVPTYPPVEEWGWKITDKVPTPLWSTLPEASSAIKELIKCGCNPTKGCRGRCKCKTNELPCTELCKCNGDCEI